jgi:tubby-related protein 1
MYAANVLGSRGPRKMQVAIPALDNEDQIMRWKDGHGPNGPGDDMLTRMKDRNFRDLTYLINKPPRWNEQVGAYVLNFNGRVTMASVKNFQLVDPEEQNAVVLQVNQLIYSLCCLYYSSYSSFSFLNSLEEWGKMSSRWICNIQ